MSAYSLNVLVFRPGDSAGDILCSNSAEAVRAELARRGVKTVRDSGPQDPTTQFFVSLTGARLGATRRGIRTVTVHKLTPARRMTAQYRTTCVAVAGQQGETRTWTTERAALEYATGYVAAHPDPRDGLSPDHRLHLAAHVLVERKVSQGLWASVALWTRSPRGGWERDQ